MLPIPIGHWTLAIGNICTLATFPRGVVSDAVPCLFNGVICDLTFNVVGLPKKMSSMIAHPSMICQSPTRRFLRTAAVIRSTIGLIVELSASPRRPWGPHGRSLGCAINKQAKNGYFFGKESFLEFMRRQNDTPSLRSQTAQWNHKHAVRAPVCELSARQHHEK